MEILNAVLGSLPLLLWQGDPLPLTDFAASYPAWSPDGERIAFESTRDGDDTEIYVMSADGTGIVRLTDNDADDEQPAWSPDGSLLAFVSARDGNQEIYRMRRDGSAQERLTDYAGMDVHPRFAFDGRTILFNRERGEGRQSTAAVYEMSPDGSSQKLIVEARFPLTFPAWSIDRSRILLVHWSPPGPGERRPGTEIALLSPGGEPELLASRPGSDGYPVWSRDGRRIAFASERDGGRQQVFVMNADGSGVTQVTRSGSASFARPSWSPDGSRIVCTGEEGSGARLFVVPVPPLDTER